MDDQFIRCSAGRYLTFDPAGVAGYSAALCATEYQTAGSTPKVKLHYAYKVRNIGRVRPRLRFCALC